MEFKLMYPKIIIYSIAIAYIIILVVWRKRKRYRKGVLVANTSYLKKSFYYRLLLGKYHIYNLLIKVVCMLLIVVTAFVSARIYHEDKFEEKHDNRDIILCMDTSGSMTKLNASISASLKNLVDKLTDERFGIVVFDNSALSLVPLNTDYVYTSGVLESISGNKSPTSKNEKTEMVNDGTIGSLISIGTHMGIGSSIIGDGIASCASSFKKDEDRTKILILTTDNQLAGSPLITVKEAAEYCRDNGIKIYAIGASDINPNDRVGLEEAANISGGKYFDFKNMDTDQIVNEISKLNKTSIVTKTYVLSKDFPEILFKYMLILTGILFLLDWRVRI